MAKKKVEETDIEKTNDDGLGELEEGKGGKTFLPEMQPIVVKALVEQVINIEEYLKPAFATARDSLMSAQTELSRLAHENIQHFSAPDDDGKRVYSGGGVVVEITFEKEKIKGKVVKDEDE